jgi:hypothetical protein
MELVTMLVHEKLGMLRIQRSENRQVVFTVSGRLAPENIADLEALFRLEVNGRRIVLDLKDVTLVNQEVVSFLDRCEAGGITLKNCPAYIREWIARQRRTLAPKHVGQEKE